MITDKQKQDTLDRYDPDELVDAIDLTVEEIIEAFEDKVVELWESEDEGGDTGQGLE